MKRPTPALIFILTKNHTTKQTSFLPPSSHSEVDCLTESRLPCSSLPTSEWPPNNYTSIHFLHNMEGNKLNVKFTRLHSHTFVIHFRSMISRSFSKIFSAALTRTLVVSFESQNWRKVKVVKWCRKKSMKELKWPTSVISY